MRLHLLLSIFAFVSISINAQTSTIVKAKNGIYYQNRIGGEYKGYLKTGDKVNVLDFEYPRYKIYVPRIDMIGFISPEKLSFFGRDLEILDSLKNIELIAKKERETRQKFINDSLNRVIAYNKTSEKKQDSLQDINRRGRADSLYQEAITSFVYIPENTEFYTSPCSRCSEIMNYSTDGAYVLDLQGTRSIYDFIAIKNSKNQIAYIHDFRLTQLDFAERLEKKLENDLEDIPSPIYIHSLYKTSTNSAGGVSVGIEYMANSEKPIKYISVSMSGYNNVGDRIRGSISGDYVTTGRITGPFTKHSELEYGEWDTLWYSSSTSCVKITKVKIDYMDGSSYTYVNELKKILNPNFRNNCKIY